MIATENLFNLKNIRTKKARSLNVKNNKLPREFYLQTDVLQVARQLLGKVLVTNVHGRRTAGIIVETEAYAGVNDRASHAWRGHSSKRTQIIYRAGGFSYVYLIYGMYVLFNVVSNVEGIPDAILIRAIEPIEGIDYMLERRKMKSLRPAVSNGPGKLTQSLGIDLSYYGLPLTGNKIWIEDRDILIPEENIASGPRIGVDYAGEDANRPWRFWLKGNIFVSKHK